VWLPVSKFTILLSKPILCGFSKPILCGSRLIKIAIVGLSSLPFQLGKKKIRDFVN
jgi:hypothetical protein